MSKFLATLRANTAMDLLRITEFVDANLIAVPFHGTLEPIL
jgi:hypothetical protein